MDIVLSGKYNSIGIYQEITQKDNEKCGKGSYKYLLPENPYYDQDLKIGENNQLKIDDFSEFLSGKMFNKNSYLYNRLISEKKILSEQELNKIFN